MTEITREVILDLLPLYLAGEGSPATRSLVERYLETDPELARFAKQPDAAWLPNEIPIPLSKENAMETYKEARRWMVIRTLGLAAIIAPVFMCTLGMVLGFVTMFFR
jgi:anti-sigma factor RsiW